MESDRFLPQSGAAAVMRCLMALALIATPAIASAQSLPESFTRLQSAIGSVAQTQPEQEATVSTIAVDAVALQAASSKIPAADRAEFARSLAYQSALLEQATSAPDAEANAILRDVSADLAVKRLAGTQMAAGSSFPGRVRIRVETLRSGQAVTGYVIALNPVRWRQAEPMYRLSTLSPASGAVPPGRYEVSARLNNAVVARDVIGIGLAAEDQMRIQLAVP